MSLKRSCSILIILLVLLSQSVPLHGESPVCKDLFPNLATDICWDCMFPVRIGGVIVMSAGNVPDNVDTENSDDYNPSDYVCSCTIDGKLHGGIWVSFWEPYAVIEATLRPNCYSFLFGLELGDVLDAYAAQGTIGWEKTGEKAFYNLHYYGFPVLSVLEFIKDMDFCTNLYTDIDLAYFTEVDPMWNNDELSLWINAEAAVFANPIAQAICSADCIAASADYPLNALFWCAGCWGSIYPFTGNTGVIGSPVRTTSLLTARLLAKLTRTPIPGAMELDTSGSGAKCGQISDMIRPVIKKSQYRFSMLSPVPETESCHVLGKSTFLWGENRNIPGTGETHIYLMWRKRNCCLRFL